jgi:hypothetical protein
MTDDRQLTQAVLDQVDGLAERMVSAVSEAIRIPSVNP